MQCTMVLRTILVVEAEASEPTHLLPKPTHVLDYQSGTLRFEFPYTIEMLIALRLCGVEGLPARLGVRKTQWWQ